MEGQMAEARVANAVVTIDAPRAKVWEGLVNPGMIEQYMFVTSVASEWREGSPIVWKSLWQGKAIEVRGTILRLDPQRTLEYGYSRPLFGSRPAASPPKLHHRVTIKLSDEGRQTRISVTEDNNFSKRELVHAEGSWRMILRNLKGLLEGSR